MQRIFVVNITSTFRDRYFFLCVVLFGLMVVHTLHGPFGWDFWEHSAVVREFMAHPVSPSHPQLAIDAPHAFFTPYHLGVACVARLLGWTPVTALLVVGMVNLVVLLVAFRVFVSLLLGGRETPFYALLFTLLLWGWFPWYYSGFLHLNVLGYVLPYPSTFAFALVLLAFSAQIVRVRSEHQWWLIPILVIAVVVLLSHPLSFMVLCVGLAALSIGARPFRWVDAVLLGGTLVAAFLLACTWPYFPFLRFALGESSAFHVTNLVMYDEPIRRIWPALVGLPFVILRMKRDWRDPLGWMFAGFFLLYVYGAISDSWSYGRIIAAIVFVLHLALADACGRAEARYMLPRCTTVLRRFACTCLVFAVALGLAWKHRVYPAVSSLVSKLPDPRESFGPVMEHIGPDDVVLAGLWVSWFVPTFGGGRVVAARHRLAFVPDQDERMEDVFVFFSEASSHEKKLGIIRKYNISCLLLSKYHPESCKAFTEEFAPLGRIVLEDDNFVLIRLAENGGGG